MEANNENMRVQNLWDTANAVMRGKYIAVQDLSLLMLILITWPRCVCQVSPL